MMALLTDISGTDRSDSLAAPCGCVTARQCRLHVTIDGILTGEILCRRTDRFLHLTSPREHHGNDQPSLNPHYCFLLYIQETYTVPKECCWKVWSVYIAWRCYTALFFLFVHTRYVYRQVDLQRTASCIHTMVSVVTLSLENFFSDYVACRLLLCLSR